MQRVGLAGATLLLLALVAIRPASADETAGADVPPTAGHRLSAGLTALSTHSWDGMQGGGPGAGVQVAYDLFLRPAHGLGLVAAAAIDFGSYGGDKDSMSWRQLGLRYTYLVLPSDRPRFVPLLSAGVLVGRTGGELSYVNTIASAAAHDLDHMGRAGVSRT